MNATNYYVSTTRLVLQADPDSPPSWQDLYTALPTLRFGWQVALQMCCATQHDQEQPVLHCVREPVVRTIHSRGKVPVPLSTPVHTCVPLCGFGSNISFKGPFFLHGTSPSFSIFGNTCTILQENTWEHILENTYTVYLQETTCEHHVCKSCKGGVKKLRPTCSWWVFEQLSLPKRPVKPLDYFAKVQGLLKVLRECTTEDTSWKL